LRDRGVRLGIVTGSAGGSLQRLEDEGLLGLFGAVVTGRDVARVKPDPAGLLLCAERLGIEPAEAVYVGDTPLDVRASLAAGMGAIATLTGAADCAMLSAAGPHHLIGSHERLLDVLALG
jgi:phosphoglycolate phosphatase-like HAD superfamily hydrolase